ncbi:MAG: hypothetical protein CMJ58_03355 [Planctomycetaceae bacterium]|nr:hypothetical protein [Planctomycetaceae bacterium]
MKGGEFLYQLGKRAVGALPERMLRTRPYSVYAIDLAKSEKTAADANDSSCEDVVVGWAKAVAERLALATIAAPVNLESWNGTTRRALIAWRSNAAVGGAWISSESFEEHSLGLRLDLAADDVWLHSAVVIPSHRRQGIYKKILRCAMQTLRDKGYSRLLLGVTTGNEPSRRAHASAGAVKIGQIAAARSNGMSVCVATGLVAYPSGRRVGLGRSINLRINR